MSINSRQALSAIAVVFLLSIQFFSASIILVSIKSQKELVEDLASQVERLRAKKISAFPDKSKDNRRRYYFEGSTITLAFAALQQRIENAVSAAGGQINSSTMESTAEEHANRIALSAEITISQLGMQALLFDLETGFPYIFVEMFDAHVSDAEEGNSTVHVLMSVSGQWKNQA